MTGRRRFGAVRKLSSGRWQARFRDPETNLYSNAPHTFETKTAAAKWLSAIETDMARGDWHDPKRGQVVFRSVAEQWYATKLHLRPSTQHIYRTLLDRHMLPTFAEVPVGSITTLDVQMWISDRHRNTRMGANWGELAGLRRRYLDPLHKTVRVVEQCTEVNGHFVWGPPKTSAGTRTVVLPSFICDVMVEHLALWSEPGVEGLVFVMPEGTPLRRENFRKRVWLPACRATGVEGVRFHDLRHTKCNTCCSKWRTTACSDVPARPRLCSGRNEVSTPPRRTGPGHRGLPRTSARDNSQRYERAVKRLTSNVCSSANVHAASGAC